MNVLVVGAKGMLGTDMVSEISKRGWTLSAVDVDELDLTDPMAVAEIAQGRFGKLDWCFNCAAYTAVDKAESERDIAMMVNGIAPGYLGRACAMAHARLLHVSTDFVFDGKAQSPYTEDAPTFPLGAYGESKLQGERAVHSAAPDSVIVRTAWLYGPNGNCFPRTMIRAWLSGKDLRVVADQVGTPTYTADLARVLADLAEKTPEPGIYHTSGPELVSWHEFAIQAVETYSEVICAGPAKVQIKPIQTSDWPTPARRPKYSALSFAKVSALGIAPMRPLKSALQEFAERLHGLGGDAI